MSPRQTFRSTGWKGVLTTPEPDIATDILADLKNGYLADPPNGSAAYGRPGVTLLNGGTTISATGRWQLFHTHTNLDASTINFMVIGGKLFRVDAQLSTFEDVTPVGITIDSAQTTKVFALSLIGMLAFTDGVNRPWEATNLTASPITGTYIDYDGIGGAWTAFGAPADYGGAPFFILTTVNGVARRADISWGQPGSFSIGYQQPNFDNNWTLSTNDANPLYALQATNTALYYFRSQSIGAASGVVGPDLASTATEDVVAFNVGTQSQQTVKKYGYTIYFCDSIGRPYSWIAGQAPRELWKQMRSWVNQSTTGFPTVTSVVATAAIEPTLNIYIVAIWSPTPSTQEPPQKAFVFDAATGTFLGYWTFDDTGDGGVPIEQLGVFIDSAGRPTLMIGSTGGFLYSFNSLSSVPSFLTTEDGDFLTTEDGTLLTTEGLASVWTDNLHIPPIAVTAGKMGYSDDVVWNVDRITTITLNDVPIRVTTVASMSSSEVDGIPEPAVTQDDTFRLITGSDAVGRGPQVSVSPIAADNQFICNSIALVAVPSLAGPDDA